MKSLFLLLFLMGSNFVFAQYKIVQKLPLTIAKGNILDANPNYKRAPIAFVPYTETADARSRGYKSDSLYTWTDPNGGRHRAYGRDILKQVNDVEKELCARGHSFRQKNTFDGLKKTLPKNFPKEGIYTIPPQFYETKNTGRISSNYDPSKFGNRNYTIGGTVYPYLGLLQRSAEFPGIISDVEKINYMPEFPTIFTIPIILACTPDVLKNVSTCSVELYKNTAKTGTPIMYGIINVKSPTTYINWTAQLRNNSENIPPVTNGMGLYNYNAVFDNGKNKLPKATKEHDYYYIDLKFKDANNNPIIISLQNNIVLDNSLSPAILISSFISRKINAFNFRATDPVINAFGLYAKSNGFIANASSEPHGFTGKGINKKSSISADVSLGAVYYNFEHLIDNNAPLSNELEILGFNFSAAENYYKAENNAPAILRKGNNDLFKNPNTKLEFRVLGQKIENNNYEIVKEIFNQRFFIGPVPCQATITLKGNAGIKASGTFTQNSCNLNATVEPYASLNVIGAGGVDAYIAYAKVVVDVNLLTVSFPINFNVVNASKANVDAAIKVAGLSGKVGFVAGFCIPIPFLMIYARSFQSTYLIGLDPKKHTA